MEMMVKEKIVKLIIICFLAFILIASGCITKKEVSDKTQDTPDETPSSYPIYPNVLTTSYTNDSLWTLMNASLELERSFYVTDSEIQDIVDWYLNEENIGEYDIKQGDEHGGASIVSVTNIDPYNASYGHVKLNKNNETEGLFVFIIKALEEMKLEKENLMGIATGPWNLIIVCEKTGNITELKQ